MADVWCKYYEYEPGRKFDVLPQEHPHQRKANVPEESRVCICQINENPTGSHGKGVIAHPMCTCFDFKKAYAVHMALWYASPEKNEEEVWVFRSETHRRFCKDAWSSGGYGSTIDGELPNYLHIVDMIGHERGNVIRYVYESLFGRGSVMGEYSPH